MSFDIVNSARIHSQVIVELSNESRLRNTRWERETFFLEAIVVGFAVHEVSVDPLGDGSFLQENDANCFGASVAGGVFVERTTITVF